jgi:hypothetical protein
MPRGERGSNRIVSALVSPALRFDFDEFGALAHLSACSIFGPRTIRESSSQTQFFYSGPCVREAELRLGNRRFAEPNRAVMHVGQAPTA